MIDPLTIFAAFGPVVVDGIKAAISRWIAPDTFKPATIEQAMQLRDADLKLFQAITQAGGANPSYLWVEAIVRLMRPAVALAVVGAYVFTAVTQPDVPDVIANFASAIGFYLFGDRTLFYARRGK